MKTAWIGGKKRFFYGASPEEASASREEAKTPKPQATQVHSDPSSFAYFVYNTYAPRKAEGISPTYKARVNGLLKHHILPALGPLPIARIGYEDVDQLKRHMKRQGENPAPLSPKSKREALILAREILSLYASLAKARGLSTRDDWKLVKLPRAPRKKQRDEPGDGFQQKLEAAAAGTWMEGPLAMALYLGLRRGEVCGLKWSAIDRKAMRIKIAEQRHPLLPSGSAPKMNKDRDLPLIDFVLKRIDQTGDKSSVYIFTYKSGKPIRPNQVTDAMAWLCRRAGVRRVTFHDLRSHAASNMAAQGGDVWSILEILGHTKIDTTQLYVNQREANKRETLQRLSPPAKTADNA